MFDYREGKNIDQVFFRGARCSWRLRMKTAQSLFEQALSVWNFPPEIGCAALLSDNLIFLQEDSPLTVNFVVRPMEALQQRDMVFLLSDQIRKVLLQRWDSPIEERQFVRELCTGTAQSAAAAYNRWNATKPSIQAAYEKIESKNAMSRQLYLLFMNLKDWLRTRFHKQKGGRGH